MALMKQSAIIASFSANYCMSAYFKLLLHALSELQLFALCADHTGSGTPVMKYAQPSILLAHKSEANNSLLMPNSSSANKRKALKSSLNLPSEPKKTRIQPLAVSSAAGGIIPSL